MLVSSLFHVFKVQLRSFFIIAKIGCSTLRVSAQSPSKCCETLSVRYFQNWSCLFSIVFIVENSILNIFIEYLLYILSQVNVPQPSELFGLHPFFYKNLFYKNIKAEIADKIRTLLRTSPASNFWEKLYSLSDFL